MFFLFRLIKRIFHLILSFWGIILLFGLIYQSVIKPMPTPKDLTTITISHYRVICHEEYNRGTYYQPYIIYQHVRFEYPDNWDQLADCQQFQAMVQQDAPLTIQYDPIPTLLDNITGANTHRIRDYDIYGMSSDHHQYRRLSTTLKEKAFERHYFQAAILLLGLLIVLGMIGRKFWGKKRKPYYNDLM